MKIIRKKHFAAIILLILVTFTFQQIDEAMAIGEKYSKQGHALYAAIQNELVAQGKCVDIKSCYTKVSIYGEHGNKVNLNVYAVTDREILAVIIKFVVMHGMATTKGVPIAIHVFPERKENYLGLKAAFNLNEPMITVEVNK